MQAQPAYSLPQFPSPCPHTALCQLGWALRRCSALQDVAGCSVSLPAVCLFVPDMGGWLGPPRWAGCRRLDGTGHKETEGDRTSWLCLPRQWRLGATQPLCLLSAGGEAGGHAIVSAWCGDNQLGGWLFQVPPGEPRASQTFPPTPSEGLGKEGSQAGWVLRGGPRRPVSGMEASATAPAAAQLLPVSLCRACRGCWAWPQRGQVPVTAVDQCPGWALLCLVWAASPCGRVAVPDGLGAAVGHLLPR